MKVSTSFDGGKTSILDLYSRELSKFTIPLVNNW